MEQGNASSIRHFGESCPIPTREVIDLPSRAAAPDPDRHSPPPPSAGPSRAEPGAIRNGPPFERAASARTPARAILIVFLAGRARGIYFRRSSLPSFAGRVRVAQTPSFAGSNISTSVHPPPLHTEHQRAPRRQRGAGVGIASTTSALLRPACDQKSNFPVTLKYMNCIHTNRYRNAIESFDSMIGAVRR